MKQILLLFVAAVVAFQMVLLSARIVPIKFQQEELTFSSTEIMLEPSQRILSAIKLASARTGISGRFLVALIYSESSFNERAVSTKSYHGLAQIQWPIYDPDLNVLSGAKTFVEKLKIANGDYVKAIMLYKGWGNNMGSEEGLRQARKVLRIARTIQM